MTSAWWAAFGPAEANVSCGSGQHRIRWADGMLQALDHPDAEGELVLAALGGDATPCLEMLRLWDRHSDDLRVLTIGPRSAKDGLTITPAVLREVGLAPSGSGSMPRALSRGYRASPVRTTGSAYIFGSAGLRSSRSFSWTGGSHLLGWRPAGAWPGRPDDEPEGSGLLRLLALGQPFQFRLSGAVAHAWSADGQQAGKLYRARPTLTAALAGRLAGTAARWLGIDPGDVDARLHDGPGWGKVEPTRQRLRASLPTAWLASVWSPGLAVIGGHLVVSVREATWPQAQVLALAAPGQDPVELTVRFGHREWTITP